MTVYKIQKKLIVLMSILLVMSFFFSYSVYKSDFSAGAMAVCFVLITLLGFNLAVLISKKFSVEDGVIYQTTLYGKKELNISELDEIGVVNLRWRIILILSDPHKFVFISSLYEDFDKFLNYLQETVPQSCKCHIEKVTEKKIKRKNMFLMLMLVLGSAFFVLAGFYNIIYR